MQHDCYQSDECGDIPYNDYDLAILELETSADLTSYLANSACLPFEYGLDDFVGENCYATGFGDTKGMHPLTLYQNNDSYHNDILKV